VDLRERAGKLLRVVDLRAEFRVAKGRIRAVDGVSFALDAGEVLAVVGESGSGKTALALSLVRLLPEPAGQITGGRVLFGGQDVLTLASEEMRLVRGRGMAMIFQEPGAALNPVMTVGEQVCEAARWSERSGRRPDGTNLRSSVRRRALLALAQAGVPSAERRFSQYPHELSGGLKQRVMIAMALVGQPPLLIADEPTTALDVTTQARLLDLLAYLRARLGLALLLITHDLGVVARIADRVAVMYAGRLVEIAGVRAFFGGPAHPYSRGLYRAASLAARSDGRLEVIEGSPPDLAALPPGCPFAPRCRAGQCPDQAPPPRLVGADHLVYCWLAGAGP
jgi:oligopeptide transport system ATP-binding protein